METQGLLVTFLDQTGAKSVKARISPTVPVSRILPSIITKMQLPVVAPDGTPMSYSLDHKEGGRRLLENQTLPEAGVRDGDHLVVFPEITAGWREVVDATERMNGFFEMVEACHDLAISGMMSQGMGKREAEAEYVRLQKKRFREKWVRRPFCARFPRAGIWRKRP